MRDVIRSKAGSEVSPAPPQSLRIAVAVMPCGAWGWQRIGVGLYAFLLLFLIVLKQIFVQIIFGKDEVGSSNLPSSSTETRCPARDSGFLLFSVGKFAYAKPIQKPIPIKFDG